MLNQLANFFPVEPENRFIIRQNDPVNSILELRIIFEGNLRKNEIFRGSVQKVFKKCPNLEQKHLLSYIQKIKTKVAEQKQDQKDRYSICLIGKSIFKMELIKCILQVNAVPIRLNNIIYYFCLELVLNEMTKPDNMIRVNPKSMDAEI